MSVWLALVLPILLVLGMGSIFLVMYLVGMAFKTLGVAVVALSDVVFEDKSFTKSFRENWTPNA